MPSVAIEPLTIFQFRVSLLNNEFVVWRRVQMPKNFEFHHLHLAIQCAMDWEGGCKENHFFEAVHNSLDKKHTIGSPGPFKFNEQTVKLSDYFSAPNDSAFYYYDYESKWYHRIDLEEILPAVEGAYYPICIGGIGV